MKVTNSQLILLLPVVEREIEADPQNFEWRKLHEDLSKIAAFRKLKYDSDFELPPLQVWGKDYA